MDAPLAPGAMQRPGRGRVFDSIADGIDAVTPCACGSRRNRTSGVSQHSPHKIQGIGAGFVPEILDRSVIDEVVRICSERAIESSRALARSEGIAGGISSGAAIAAALEIGGQPESAGKTIVAIVPSFAERYLSTALFEGM
jgi:cysteine synthase A